MLIIFYLIIFLISKQLLIIDLKLSSQNSLITILHC